MWNVVAIAMDKLSARLQRNTENFHFVYNNNYHHQN